MLACALLAACTTSLAAEAADTAATESRLVEDASLASRYWRSVEELPQRARERLPAYCPGAYVAPDFPDRGRMPVIDQPVHAEAQQAEYRVDGVATLTGDVAMRQGDRTVRAGRATVDTETLEAELTGGVLFEEPFVAASSDVAVLNLDARSADLDDVEFFLFDAEIRGRAEQMSRDEAGTMALRKTTFTRCEPGNDGWRISSSWLTLEEGAVFATARNATLRMKNVPIFYTPYIRFPVSDDRQSGFMFPDLGYSSEEGLDLTVPYYLNLAPNYDATLSPRIITNRGLRMGAEFRHLSGWQNTSITAEFLPDDDLFDGTFDRDDFDNAMAQGLASGEFQPADRWLYGVQHRGNLGRFSTLVNYTAVSDRDYVRDLGSDLDSDVGVTRRIDLERMGALQYRRGGLYARVWAQRFQRLDEVTTQPYQRLPEIEVSYEGRLLGALEYSVGAEWVSFTRDNADLAGRAAIVGDRLHLEPRLRLPLNWSWGFVNLTGGYRYTSYELKDFPHSVEPKPDRGIALASAGAGLYFDRDVNLFGAEMVQTLDPRVFYLYQEFEDQSRLPRFDAGKLTFAYDQLYRDNRFTGIDRIGDANHLAVGITTRFVDRRTGRERLRASIGQIKYFKERRVTLSGAPDDDDGHGVSELAGEVSWRVTSRIRAQGTLVWDTAEGQVDEAAASLQYRGDNRHLFNVGYRNRRARDIDQTDVSVYWPISRSFAGIGRWNYDLKSKRTIEGLAGIEYNNCCWQLRIVARHFLDSPSARSLEDVDADRGIFLQIVFKGMAGFGGNLDAVMRRGIKGYRPEDNYGI